ncbi:MAG: ribokinase [Candidatus Micrarchaeaceae archaeon]
MRAKDRIIVVGNINMDLVVEADKAPGIGEYTYGKALHFIPGGNGMNQAVAARRLDADVQLVGFVGEDVIGKELIWAIQQEDIGTENIKALKNSHSGSVLYLIANKEERHVVIPGSNMKCTVKDLPYIEFSVSDIVISQLTLPQPVIIHVFKKAKQAGAATIINLFPNYAVKKEILMLSDFVVLNEVELAFRTGSSEYANAQHKDLQMDPGTVLRLAKKLRAREDQVIIVTLAERGVIGIIGDEITQVKGLKVKFVDATGAGDCFIGAFATAIAEDMSFSDALKFANCAAALSVQKMGSTTSFPMRKKVEQVIARLNKF